MADEYAYTPPGAKSAFNPMKNRAYLQQQAAKSGLPVSSGDETLRQATAGVAQAENVLDRTPGRPRTTRPDQGADYPGF